MRLRTMRTGMKGRETGLIVVATELTSADPGMTEYEGALSSL